MHSLTVKTSTSIIELNHFLKGVGNDEKLRAKKLPNGDLLLYTSLGGNGTGLKNLIFKTIDKRRLLAASTIDFIQQNAKPDPLSEPSGAARFGSPEEYIGTYTSNTEGKKELSIQNVKRAVHAVALGATLPTGVTCNSTGDLSGKCIIEAGPTKAKNLQELELYKGKTIAAYIQDANSSLKLKKVHLGCEIEPIQEMAEEATSGSFSRTEYAIPQKDGSIFNSYELTETGEERTKPITAALRNFAGTSKATKVLSLVLHQAIPTTFVRYLHTADGQAMNFLRPISSLNTVKRAIFTTGSDGVIRKVEDTRGLGGAKFNLSHRDGNFVLSFDWSCYFETAPGYEDVFPLEKDHAIRIDYQAEILINEKKAHEGELAIEIPDPVKATFSGRLKRTKQDSHGLDMQDQRSVVHSMAVQKLAAIKLHFDGEKASTIFSVLDDRDSLNKKETILFNKKFSISKEHDLSTSVREAVSQYIKNQGNIENLALSEFLFSNPDEALDKLLRLNRAIRERVDEEVKNFFQQGPAIGPEELKESAKNLTMHMVKDLELLKLGSEFLTNKNFINRMPKASREALLDLGQSQAALHQSLRSEPNGPYFCLSSIAGLAINSPEEFSRSLEAFKNSQSQ